MFERFTTNWVVVSASGTLGGATPYVLMYVVNNFSVFYLVTILNEFIYYLLVSVIIDNTAKLIGPWERLNKWWE